MDFNADDCVLPQREGRREDVFYCSPEGSSPWRPNFMDIEGTYAFEDVSVEQVWNKLLDPEVLARAIPGCQRLEATGEDTYEATMTVGISAVKGTYSGRIVIDDKQPPHHYRIAVEGSGTRGFIRGEGTLDLAQDDSRTIVTYKGTAQLGGAIAGVGMRMVGGAAKMLINQFFGAIKNELATNI